MITTPWNLKVQLRESGSLRGMHFCIAQSNEKRLIRSLWKLGLYPTDSLKSTGNTSWSRGNHFFFRWGRIPSLPNLSSVLEGESQSRISNRVLGPGVGMFSVQSCKIEYCALFLGLFHVGAENYVLFSFQTPSPQLLLRTCFRFPESKTVVLIQ